MAMVQCKQYKAFKRDIKPNGTMTGDSLTAYEFLRANLEYVKVSQISSTHEFLRENLEYVKVLALLKCFITRGPWTAAPALIKVEEKGQN